MVSGCKQASSFTLVQEIKVGQGEPLDAAFFKACLRKFTCSELFEGTVAEAS